MARQASRSATGAPQPATRPARRAAPKDAAEKPEAAAATERSGTAEAEDAGLIPVSAAGTAIDPRSLLFDPDWYRDTYPDVAAAGLDPIRHFFENGAREGRQPNPFFDTARYVESYADVAAAKMNPFLHYLLYGAREGRRPS